MHLKYVHPNEPVLVASSIAFPLRSAFIQEEENLITSELLEAHFACPPNVICDQLASPAPGIRTPRGIKNSKRTICSNLW